MTDPHDEDPLADLSPEGREILDRTGFVATVGGKAFDVSTEEGRRAWEEAGMAPYHVTPFWLVQNQGESND